MERFVLVYTPKLNEYCRSIGVPENDTDDLIQEVFLKLLHGIRSYDPEKGRFRHWLRRVLSRTLWLLLTWPPFWASVT
jgi:RNA polymerase sigma factor (sigma-70 family)